MVDPLHQFEIYRLIPIQIGKWDISFTNSSLFMLLTTLTVCLVTHYATKQRRIIPTAPQIVLEMSFEFVENMLKTYAGKQALAYFPYVFSLFLFILFGNLIGLLPYSFTFTSHIIVTFALASLVFLGVTLVGFLKHGLRFFHLFMPQGIPIYVAPLLVPIEIISYLSRPVSLAVRLFANMVAGHIMLKIFAGFAALLASSIFLPAAILPVGINIAVTAFEFLVAVLQAYVFTILTCIYLNDALNLH